MANYFNTLPLREQTCSSSNEMSFFMDQLLEVFANGVEALKGKKLLLSCGAHKRVLEPGLNLVILV